MADAIIDGGTRRFVGEARRAVLATRGASGLARLVPICFVLVGSRVYTPLDDKPKSVIDARQLARVRDIVERPGVSVLVDRWDEDWSRLAWVRLEGTATLVEPGVTEHLAAIDALRKKYPQYAGHAIERRPLIRVAAERVRAWGRLEG